MTLLRKASVRLCATTTLLPAPSLPPRCGVNSCVSKSSWQHICCAGGTPQECRCQRTWGEGQGCTLRAEESNTERSGFSPVLEKVIGEKGPGSRSLGKGPIPRQEGAVGKTQEQSTSSSASRACGPPWRMSESEQGEQYWGEAGSRHRRWWCAGGEH